jgi:chromosome segregation ATPase
MVTDEEIKALPEELESVREELARLRQEKEALTGELETRDTRIAEFEQLVANKDSQITTLKQSLVESDEKLTTISDSLAEAVSSYKVLVVRANPGIVEEFVTGDTIEAINQSLESAKSLIGKVRQGLEAEMAMTKVPAGAPQRTPIDFGALSSREKIQYGIGGKK